MRKDELDDEIVKEFQKPTDTALAADVTPAQPIPAGAPVQTRYFTEGELFPWKGRWWKVRLLEVNGERIIGLEMQKPTEREKKLEARKQRWAKQHPRHNAASAKLLNFSLRTLPGSSSAPV